MSDVESRFHEAWLGLVQPIEGLVVSVPVLVDAQCMQRQPPETQHRLLELCPLLPDTEDERHIADLGAFLTELLDLTPDLFDAGEELSLYVPEGCQTIKPTMGLHTVNADADADADADEKKHTEASQADSHYVMLVWNLPEGLDLDKPETKTGPWEYPPAAKFDRLLRHCRVPIGLLTNPDARMAVHLPSMDDGTVFKVLERLIVFHGQRLSYRTLDVEQIGSVYEALMGFHIMRLTSPSVRIKIGSKKSAARAWVEIEELLARKSKQRSMWLKSELGFDNSVVKKVTKALKDIEDEETALEALSELTGPLRQRERHRAGEGKLVVQPGLERRRTSSHYTPRSLSAPIVSRTLDPLIACLGEEPKSEDLLLLTICDPAMGSGAFLVEACRYLADHVVAAWTREGRFELIADANDDVVNHARRLVAQRCLYGVDKNPYAVNLAKLSLWLVTLARDLPFMFLDHALRHGDSLVGLDFDQIRSFHWKPGGSKQIEIFGKEIEAALDEAVEIRQQIHELSDDTSPTAQRENYRKNWWQFGEYRPGLFAAIRDLDRCLVTARTSKHLAFSFQSTGRIFSENLVAFATERHS